MNQLPDWMYHAIEESFTCQFASTTARAIPVALPVILHYFDPDVGTPIISSPVRMKRVENVRQRPKVAILFSPVGAGPDEPKHVLLVQGLAEVDGGLCGCAVAFVCHEPGGHTIFNMASPTFKLRFMYMAGYEDEAEFDRFAEGFRLNGAEVKSPYLVLAGEDDELSPIEYTYQLFDEIPMPKKLVVYQGERHGFGSGSAAALGPQWMNMIADWFVDRFAGKPMQSERVLVDATGQQQTTPV